jgi:hypothetical protein
MKKKAIKKKLNEMLELKHDLVEIKEYGLFKCLMCLDIYRYYTSGDEPVFKRVKVEE